MKKSISVKGKTHDRLKGFLDGEPMGPWVEKLINDALDAAEEERARDYVELPDGRGGVQRVPKNS